MPDFPQCCVNNVNNIPGGKLCSWDMCKRIQDRLNHYCKESGQNPCAAVPQEEMGQPCYCCCSCFAYDTPIEAAPGEYVMVQDIVAHVDQILAGSYSEGAQAPTWEQRVVDYSDGISAGEGEEELEFDYMYYVTYQAADGSTPPQALITTVDHLFLRPNGKVTPVQFLVPGDEIVSSHGGLSVVRFVVPAKYKGGLHHLMFDGFTNESLDNHLLSANGVVTADYAVQLAYSNGTLNPELLDAPAEDVPLRASEGAYHARYANEHSLAFIGDKELWPKGLTPHAAEPMINIPIYAKSFVSHAQAEDIAANAPMLPPDNTADVTTALWLFDIFGSFYPGPIYLVDWKNEQPNGFSWETNRQRFILLTGGLLRIQRFSQEGLSLVLGHLVAESEGVKCVGPADYDAVFTKMRKIWRNNLYVPSFTAAYDQVSTLFSYVSAENAEGRDEDRCGHPSLECRLMAMKEAASMGPLPDCADPSQYFGVVSAQTGRQLRQVAVKFNKPVDPETAQTKENYAIVGASVEPITVVVQRAEVSSHLPKQVRLTVSGIEPATDYTVTVTNVISSSDLPLDPEHHTATFRTGAKMN